MSNVFAFNSVSLEIAWTRLVSVVDEAAATLVRSAFSPIIREAHDYACVLFDAEGRSLAQSTTSVPSFIGTMPRTLDAFRKELGPNGWNPGDVVITNDPWIGSGHLQDISMAAPIFNKTGELVAFSGVVAHPPDMGGRWSPEAREIYEEGLQIPICKVVDGGVSSGDILALIRRNVRVPDQVIGDIFAMVASCTATGTQLMEFMSDAGLTTLSRLGDEIHRRSENAVRRNIAKIPSGTYRYTMPIDGFDEQLHIAVAMHVSKQGIQIDYEGSSGQVANALNCPLVYTTAYTLYTLKCALDPDGPNNEGALRPFQVSAPEGTLLNPRFPSAVGARNITGHQLSSALFTLLAQALPPDDWAGRLVADSASPRPLLVFSGHQQDRRPFSTMVFVMGGMGGRPEKDGLSCVAFPATTRNVPVEVLESTAPLLVEKKMMIAGSGGAGAHRGGDGQEMSIRVTSSEPVRMSIFGDRNRFPPRGLNGGDPGHPTRVLINGVEVVPKGTIYLNPGDLVSVFSPGGGGFGRRDRDGHKITVEAQEPSASTTASEDV